MAALALAASRRSAEPAGPVGLFTTLPIMWSEGTDLATELSGTTQPHWAKATIAGQGAIVPLDALAGPPGYGPLDRLDRLVMAQPRILSPAENVALDAWVRDGGRLLLLADPLLTEESAYPLGDPRRPQGTVLLSPILKRWNLELRFDDLQDGGERRREVMGMPVPIDLAGQFVTRDGSGCRPWAGGLAVTCAIGKGRLVAFADAAVIEREDPDGSRQRAFEMLLEAAFLAR